MPSSMDPPSHDPPASTPAARAPTKRRKKFGLPESLSFHQNKDGKGGRKSDEYFTQMIPTSPYLVKNHAKGVGNGEEVNLGINFAPGPYDVICARGKVAWNHSGNKFFRSIVKQNTERYAAAVETKIQRTRIVTEVVNEIRSRGNGFVKQEEDTGCWVQVGNLLAREKVGQHFRNALSTYKSSSKNKKYRRRAATERLSQRLHSCFKSEGEGGHVQHASSLA